MCVLQMSDFASMGDIYSSKWGVANREEGPRVLQQSQQCTEENGQAENVRDGVGRNSRVLWL